MLFRSTTHPRTNGTFPRVLADYTLGKGVISLETAVFKMTGFTAAKFGLHDRGLVRRGFYADLVILDPERLKDCSTYLEPFNEPEGIDFVFVNGVPALENGKITGSQAGCVLRMNDKQ